MLGRKKKASDPEQQGEQKILLIDDEADFTALFRANLEEEGYVVLDVNDPAKALEAARRFQPDLCLIDVVMPGMDGGDVVANMQADPALKSIPVVMLTALVGESSAAGGFTMRGGLPFISKTSDFTTILSCIHHFLPAPGADEP